MTFPLSVGWRHLLFANWPVDADRLASHVPTDLAVGQFQGSAWLSIVALRAVRTRPRGTPTLVGLSFPQVTLRTYVSADGAPGVYVFSIDAASVLSVLGGRLFHRLPYYNADVSLRWRDGRAHVSSRRRHPGARPAQFVASYEPDGERFEPDPDSLPGFLTARRRLYVESQGGRLRHTDVRHPSWALQEADPDVRANTLFRASGLETPDAAPTCFYSRGTDVRTTDAEPLVDRTL